MRVREMGCRRDDEFTRQGQDGTLDGHQQRDERIATGVESALIPVDQTFEHRSLISERAAGASFASNPSDLGLRCASKVSVTLKPGRQEMLLEKLLACPPRI